MSLLGLVSVKFKRKKKKIAVMFQIKINFLHIFFPSVSITTKLDINLKIWKFQ